MRASVNLLKVLIGSHERTDKGDNEAGADSADILWDEPNSGTHLSGNGNGELGVEVSILVGSAGGNEVLIDIVAYSTG